MNPVDYACFLYAHATIWRKGSLPSESRCDSGAGLIGRSGSEVFLGNQRSDESDSCSSEESSVTEEESEYKVRLE